MDDAERRPVRFWDPPFPKLKQSVGKRFVMWNAGGNGFKISQSANGTNPERQRNHSNSSEDGIFQ
jgi:hypothetical protein